MFPKLGWRLLVLVLSSVLAACGSSGGDDGSVDNGGSGSSDATCVTWPGSANGVFIMDGSGEPFCVNAGTRRITFITTDPVSGVITTTSYTNTRVDGNGVFSLDGIELGRVTYVQSTLNQTITAFVGFNDQFLDISGPAASPTFNCETGLMPAFVSAQFDVTTGVEITASPSGVPADLQPAAGTSVLPNLNSIGWKGGEGKAVAN